MNDSNSNLLAFFLNANGGLITRETISIGTLTESLIHPREVFEPGVRLGAASVILAHNHPSGIVEPSDEDKAVTIQIREAGKVLGIELADHIILARNQFLSFKRRGLLSS